MVAHRRIRHGTGTYEWHVKFRGNKGAVRMGADTRTTSLSDDVMIQSTDGGLTLIPPSPFSQITRDFTAPLVQHVPGHSKDRTTDN